VHKLIKLLGELRRKYLNDNNMYESPLLAVKSIPLLARHQWLIPVILPSWETEMEKIMVPGQPGENKKFVRPHFNKKRKAGCGAMRPKMRET
jgi:hypothetical protein